MFRIFYSLYAAAIFIIVMLLIFPFVLIASLWGRETGGNMIYRICTFWADIWFFCVGIRIKKIYESNASEPDGKQIIIANHISYLDIPIIVKVFRNPIRVLGKIEMEKIPVFGFIYKYAVVCVDRSNGINRARSLRLLKRFLKTGIGVFVFPEGTFNQTTQPLIYFHNGAFRAAKETGTAIQPVVFLDTFSLMHYSSIFTLKPGVCRVGYTEKITKEEVHQYSMEELKQLAYKRMEDFILKHKAVWVLSSEED
ncbi:MAG: 1-acyl-sn-glycerol-3-phosphate acyltransferase [Bacteroidia bacterium]|nr:MAG: 1-acyl-sn-glycerol-3-phosphate acyltransferase [Bacteroidia bacterium]